MQFTRHCQLYCRSDNKEMKMFLNYKRSKNVLYVICLNPKLALTRLNYFQLLFNESDFILEFKKGLNKYRTSASQILNEIYEKLKLKLFCWHCKEWKIGLKVSHETQMLMILDSNFLSIQHICIRWYYIEEGLNQKTRQRSLRLFGGQNSCSASCFASVYLEQTVEFNCLFQIDRLSSTVYSKQTG